jgi:hypothetical protein
MGALLFSQYDVPWGSFVWAGGSGCWNFDSSCCFFSVKCGCSVLVRFLILGGHCVCFALQLPSWITCQSYFWQRH